MPFGLPYGDLVRHWIKGHEPLLYCGLYGIGYEEVPLDAAMRVQIADYRRPCSAILLANPNAPTGIGLPRAAIETLAAEHPDQLVAIDEAYVDFGAESAVPLVARHDNLLIVQTLSKSRALAGLRVGFAIGQRPLIEALERVKDSFNSYPLDCLAIAGAAGSKTSCAIAATVAHALACLLKVRPIAQSVG